jgi:hypothetical protein
MTITWKSVGFAFLALAAAAWLARQDSSAHSELATNDTAASSIERICNPHDPYAPCAGATRTMYPAGGGLYFSLDELT